MKKERVFIFGIFLIITSVFFFPIFKGKIPFPGDLLVSVNAPYNAYSYLGYAPGGVPTKFQGPDVITELYPWKYFVIQSLKKLQIPFWNPYNFSGNPLMANFQSGTFYPFNIIFFLFNFNTAWAIYIFLTPLLAGFFTYFYLREIQISKVASVYAGIVFAFSSYMVVWMEYGNIGHTLLWLPLALFITEKLLKKFDYRYFFLQILIFWFALLAGYIQAYFYIISTLAFYFIFKFILTKKKNMMYIALYLCALLLPILLSLFQILPTLELFKYSTRGNYSLTQITNLLNPWWYLITIIAPNFFGHPAAQNYWFNGTYIERVAYFGLIPLVFAFTSLVYYKKKKEVFIFGVIFFLTLFISTDLLITKYFYLLPIPVISTTVPTRVLGLFVFSGSILSAIGFDFFLQKKNNKSLFIVSICIALILTIAFVVLLVTPKNFGISPKDISVAKRNLVLPSLMLFMFFIISGLFIWKDRFLPLKKNILFVVIGAIYLITMGDLFYFFHKITPFSPNEFIYPTTDVVSYLKNNGSMNRFWGYGTAYISSNFQTVDGTYSPEGNDPLHLINYTQLLETSKDGTIPQTLPRPDANVYKGFGQDDLKNNLYRQKILNLLGVDYLLNKNGGLTDSYTPDTAIFDEKTYKLIWQKAPWQVYKNLHAVPRFFLTSNYIIIKDKRTFFKTFFDRNFDERKTLILNQDANFYLQPMHKSIVKLLSYNPNNIEFTTSTDTSAWLFLSDNYYPGWKATIDTTPTRIYLADYSFRAVLVPSGTHTVTFYYDSPTFRNGVVVSVSSAFLLFIIFLSIKYKTYEKFKNKK